MLVRDIQPGPGSGDPFSIQRSGNQVRINVQLLRQNVDPGTAPQRFQDTIELVDRMIERVGDISLDLRPPLLDDLGLVPALRGYLTALGRRSGVAIEVDGAAGTVTILDAVTAS